MNSVRNTSNNSIYKIAIPDICTATQLSSGDIHINYKDGSSLIVNKNILYYIIKN